MKRSTLIKAVLTLTLMVCGISAFTQETEQTETTDIRWECLISAISAVESSGNPSAVNGRHVGFLQISPCVVDDCNKISKTEKNLEKALRVWNGGPRYSIRGTNGYVRKVMKVFNRLINK